MTRFPTIRLAVACVALGLVVAAASGRAFFPAIPAAVAFVVAAIGGACARGLAARFDWFDRPGGRKDHARPIPLGGGLAIAAVVLPATCLGFVLPAEALLSRCPLPAKAQAVCAPADLASGTERVRRTLRFELPTCGAALALLTLLGWRDDRGGLDWRFRLAIQTASAAGLAAFLPSPSLFSGGDFWGIPPRLPAWLLGTFWIVGLVNAFNMLDNMDALSAGTALVTACLLLQLPLGNLPPGTFLALFPWLAWTAVWAGGLLGFLWHNAPPARLFMGDAGSYLIGGTAAILTLRLTAAPFADICGPSGPWPIVLGLTIVPWYDLGTVVAIRLREGRSPFAGDRCHLSHRLAARGCGKVTAVLLILIGGAFCGAVALLIPHVKFFSTPYFAPLAAAAILATAVLDVRGFLASRRAPSADRIESARGTG